MISADFEDVRAGGAIVRKGGQFTLGRPADREESALLEFVTKNIVAEFLTGGSSLALQDRMKWGDFTLFGVASHGARDDHMTLPVRCAKTCVASLSIDESAEIPDPEFLHSTFAYFQEERARLVSGELARARSFPVALNVLPGNLPPTSPFPITFRVDVRLAFAANASPAIYDFAARSWRGKAATHEAEWHALAGFLAGLRQATPAHVAGYLNRAFANESAEHFVYNVNAFETRSGVLNITSPLLEPDAFAEKVADWQAIVALGTVQDGPAVRLLFATSAKLDDVQEMPIQCGSVGCRVAVEDWVNYVQLAIQQPALLRLYLSMFRKAMPASTLRN